MRGTLPTNYGTNNVNEIAEEPVQASTAGISTTGSNIEENTKAAKSPGSVYWWLTILGVYLAWDYVQNREKVSEAIKPRNLRANAHNLVLISAAAVIGINGMNILLTKLAAMRIPVLSKVAGAILPLYHL